MHDAWRRELAAGGDECIGKAEPTSSCRLGQRATVVTAAEAAAAEVALSLGPSGPNACARRRGARPISKIFCRGRTLAGGANAALESPTRVGTTSRCRSTPTAGTSSQCRTLAGGANAALESSRVVKNAEVIATPGGDASYCMKIAEVIATPTNASCWQTHLQNILPLR